MPVTKIVSLGNSGYLLRQRTNRSVSSEKFPLCCTIWTCINGIEYQLLLYFCWDGLHPIPMWCPCFILPCNGIQLVLFWEFQQFFWQNTVRSSFVAVWDNSFFSGTFEIFVVSVLWYATVLESPSGKWEHSGSVVECLTRDRGVEGSSLTGVTALWSLCKTHFS